MKRLSNVTCFTMEDGEVCKIGKFTGKSSFKSTAGLLKCQNIIYRSGSRTKILFLTYGHMYSKGHFT